MPRKHTRLVDATTPRLEGANGVYPLVGRTELGRSARCGVCLDDREVSKVHCAIAVENGTVRVTDQKSANGTFVNGRKVRELLLREGDELAIGNTRFTVRLGALSSPPRGLEGESAPLLGLDFVLRQVEAHLQTLRQKEAGLDAALGATEVEKLRAAAEAHCALAVTDDPAGVLVRAALQVTQADSAALLTDTAQTVRAQRDGVTEALPVSAALLEHVRASRAPLRLHDLRADSRFPLPATAVAAVHHAVLAVPMLARGELLGVLHCDSRQRADAFGELDDLLLVGLASHAALLLQTTDNVSHR